MTLISHKRGRKMITKASLNLLLRTLPLLILMLLNQTAAEQCGRQAGGAFCPGGLCCSQFGWCGTGDPYCGPGCQSQCGGTPTPTPPTPGPPPALSNLVTSDLFNQMLLHRNDNACPAKTFYTYNAFITAANSFPAFGNTGDSTARMREVAAFFGQTSHETTGGWPSAPDGPYAWGYCFKKELTDTSYCVSSAQYPCAPGKMYYGRGPIQITSNVNYGQAGEAIGVDLLNNPDLVETDPVIAFKTAIWFWMTTQSPKPSCHDVITGRWTPSGADAAAGRQPGYGVITNIINGGLECGHGEDAKVADRIGFYRRYCDMLQVSYGSNIDCYNQTPYGNALLRATV